MGTFADLGVGVNRVFQTESSSLQAGGINVDLSQREVTRLELTLPKPTAIKASFRKESFGHAIVKVFKKELQTGDKSFDDLVYISTDTPTETAALLEQGEIRRAVGLCIETAGPIEIEGTRVVAHAMGHDATDDPDVVRIVAALLA